MEVNKLIIGLVIIIKKSDGTVINAVFRDLGSVVSSGPCKEFHILFLCPCRFFCGFSDFFTPPQNILVS